MLPCQFSNQPIEEVVFCCFPRSPPCGWGVDQLRPAFAAFAVPINEETLGISSRDLLQPRKPSGNCHWAVCSNYTYTYICIYTHDTLIHISIFKYIYIHIHIRIHYLACECCPVLDLIADAFCGVFSIEFGWHVFCSNICKCHSTFQWLQGRSWRAGWRCIHIYYIYIYYIYIIYSYSYFYIIIYRQLCIYTYMFLIFYWFIDSVFSFRCILAKVFQSVASECSQDLKDEKGHGLSSRRRASSGSCSVHAFPRMAVPKNRWFIMEKPTKMDGFGGSPIYGNPWITYV